MDQQPGFWGSVAGGVVLLLAAAYRFVRGERRTEIRLSESSYSGPERRTEVKELIETVQHINTRLTVVETTLTAHASSYAEIITRLDRRDELDRRAERRAAQNFGSIFRAVSNLEDMIAHKEGWKRGGQRGVTPPDGYVLDDETPDPHA